MDPSPSGFWHNLGSELQGGSHWRDRGVVIAYAVLTGVTVVGFTLLAEAASARFAALVAVPGMGRSFYAGVNVKF